MVTVASVMSELYVYWSPKTKYFEDRLVVFPVGNAGSGNAHGDSPEGNVSSQGFIVVR